MISIICNPISITFKAFHLLILSPHYLFFGMAFVGVDDSHDHVTVPDGV
jgi:hypothetical protein